MKHITFFFISLFFLFVAFFHGPLHAVFPSVFEPVNKFILEVGPSVLYLAGFTALLIAIFTWLPTWACLVVFILSILISGTYLHDKEVSIRKDAESFHLSVTNKPVPNPPTSPPTTPVPSSSQSSAPSSIPEQKSDP